MHILSLMYTRSCSIMLQRLLFKSKRLARLVKNNSNRTISSETMPWVSVRKVKNEERIQISFRFATNGRERVFNMDRLQTEELGKTISRVQVNISNFMKTKRSKKKRENKELVAASNDVENGELDIRLQNAEGLVVADSTPNSQAWENGHVFMIAESNFDVRINVPTIKELTMPKCIMPGFSIYPNIDAEFIDLNCCDFVWYRENKENRQPETENESGENPATAARCPEDSWTILQEGQMHYMPCNDDINSRLKLVCTPSNGSFSGNVKESVSETDVTAGPGFCPFERRHQTTKTWSEPGNFRVMTYNILADTYADSDFSRDFLYPYCPPYALTRDYRYQLLLKEISGYQSDIICLQEVDRRFFLHDLQPVLEQQGYEGMLRLKDGQVPEGTATFFRKAKFRLLSQHDIVMRDCLKEEPLYKDVWDKVCQSESLKNILEERTSAFQVTVLESLENPSKKLLVGTTHLYFHPKAPHVRVIQTLICMRHLESVLKQYSTEGSLRPGMVFCGDLNSYPEGGVHHLIKNKHIPDNHADWYAGGKAEFTPNMEFTHDLDLTSACGYPRYTNYVTSFSGCLDYIYADKDRIKTVSVVPMPTHEEVTQHTALPNAVFPSDHIALICDLAWC